MMSSAREYSLRVDARKAWDFSELLLWCVIDVHWVGQQTRESLGGEWIEVTGLDQGFNVRLVKRKPGSVPGGMRLQTQKNDD